jgi:hypothetical protein
MVGPFDARVRAEYFINRLSAEITMKPRENYSTLDPALEIIHRTSPDLRNGNSNHAPMAVEALCAMGRADAVMPWLEEYRKGMIERPAPREAIPRDGWRIALGRTERVADWEEFFAIELKEAPWREVLDRWTARLGAGICASATHGVIRVGHSARALGVSESPERLRELADGLAYWAATYQELPTDMSGAAALSPREAIAKVATVPRERRRYTGTIASSLAALREFPEFAPVIGLINVSGDPARLVSELTETFARVYLANARNLISAIIFIHGVTSAGALRLMLPYLDDATARAAARFAWQAGCGLYAAFGRTPEPAGEIEPPRESRETLIDMAVAHGDEHAIKFMEACLREDTLNPSPAYLAAARSALDRLRPE